MTKFMKENGFLLIMKSQNSIWGKYETDMQPFLDKAIEVTSLLIESGYMQLINLSCDCVINNYSINLLIDELMESDTYNKLHRCILEIYAQENMMELLSTEYQAANQLSLYNLSNLEHVNNILNDQRITDYLIQEGKSLTGGEALIE